MRLLALLPLMLAGCVQPAQYYTAAMVREVAARPPLPLPSDTDNCGTPYKFKLCGITWHPSHRQPIYAEQLEDISGNIPISDMPTVIAKYTAIPEPGDFAPPPPDAGIVHRARAQPMLKNPLGQELLISD